MEQAPLARFASNPLLIIAIAMSIGIFGGHYWAAQRMLWPLVSALSLVLGFTSISLVVAKSSKISEKRLTLATTLLAAAFFLTGFTLFLSSATGLAANQISYLYDHGAITSSEPVELTGIVRGDPEPAPQSFYLTLKVERVRVRGSERNASGSVLLLARTGTQQVRTEYDSLALRHGARIRVMTTLDREDNFRNPGVLPFTEYLDRKGYDATGAIKSPLLIERLDDQRVFLPQAWLYQWRARLQKEFSGKFSPDTAGVLNAALLGNPYNITRPTAERFRSGGTFHILVISGLQIAFIAGLIFLIVRRFTRSKILQFAFATLFLWGYTVAVGGEAAVTRAALMFTLASFAPIVARHPNSLNMIAGAGIALLVWKPSDLFDPSFQLTFLSVLAIVCLAVPILRNMQRVGSWRPTMATPYPPECGRWFRVLSESLFWSEREWKADLSVSNIRYRLFKTRLAASLERWRLQRLLRFAVAAVVVSASVQVGLLPAMILYFHRISIASLALNIFVGALMAVLAFGALAAILLSYGSAWLGAPLIAVTEKVNWLMVHSVDPFSSLGAASVRLPHYSGWAASIYLVYFILLGFLVFGLARWDPLRPDVITKRSSRMFAKRALTAAGAAFGIVLLLIVLHPASSARPDGKLRVDFLDVGQGDSALLTMPNGTTILIDGGGRPGLGSRNGEQDEDEDAFERDTRSIGERVVSEYLWSRGLDRVDYIIATHADADHIDGLNSVALNFGVRSAIVARTPANDPEFAKFAETLKRSGISVETIGAGDVMRIGSVAFEVVWPPPTSNPNAPSRNNDSIVLRARLGEKTFLFTGDIEKEAEASLLNLGINLHSDVVKVAHHGSKTSSTEAFVTATHPSLAIISVGRTSMFGHPHREVVERWKAGGSQVMTTGEKGMISIVTDGRAISVGTFVRD